MENEKLQEEQVLSAQAQSADQKIFDKSDDAKTEPEKLEEKGEPKGEDNLGRLKAELLAKAEELAQKERELELYKQQLKDVIVRTAILADSKNLMAQDPELIYLILRSSCEVLQASDGGYEVVVRFENRPNESKLEFEELPLPKAIARLLDRYPCLRATPKDKGSGSQSSAFAPLTLESLKTLSFEELLARKSELESLAKRLLG